MSLGNTAGRYLCSSHFRIPHPLWFAYPKDQVWQSDFSIEVVTVQKHYFESTVGLFFESVYIFNTSSQSQRQGMSSATIVWLCYPCKEYRPCRWLFSAPLPAPAGVTLAAAMQQMPLSHLFIRVRETSEAPTSVPAVNGLQIAFAVCFLTVWLSVPAPCALRDQYSLTLSLHSSWLFLGIWIPSILTLYVVFLTVVLGMEEFIS